MEKFKKFMKKVADVWNKVISFKPTKYIVVLGTALIIFLVVIVNSNQNLVIYAHSGVVEGVNDKAEDAIFIAVENSDYFYKGKTTAAGAETKEGEKYLWYYVEGYKNKSSFENNEAAIYNSDKTEENFYGTGVAVKKVLPFMFSTSKTGVLGRERRTDGVVKKYITTETNVKGETYQKTNSPQAKVWFGLTKTEMSQLDSYTFASVIETTKLKNELGVSYLRLTFRIDETNTKYFRDFEI